MLNTHISKRHLAILALGLIGVGQQTVLADIAPDAQRLDVLQSVLTADPQSVYRIEHLPSPMDTISISNRSGSVFEIVDAASGNRHTVAESMTLAWNCPEGDAFSATTLILAPAHGGIPVQVEMLCGSDLKITPAHN